MTEQEKNKTNAPSKAPAQKPSDFQHLVRIANTDVDGNKLTVHALTKIKGVGIMFSNMICNLIKIDKTAKIGTIPAEHVSKLNEIIQSPDNYDIPSWMYNRRKDYETGEDKHLITSDLKFSRENDIKLLKKIKAYRGVRHMFGLPSRGQRTKSNFRKNKGKVTGVKRKSK